MFDNTVTIYPNLMNKKDIIGTKNQILVDKIVDRLTLIHYNVDVMTHT